MSARPMSEAPLDRAVLAWWPESFGGVWERSKWDPDTYARKTAMPHWYAHTVAHLMGMRHLRRHQPTHWVELPPRPPAES